MSQNRTLPIAPGPFYVEDGCCTRCGVPEVTAPDLFGDDESGCFIKKQPRSSAEIDRMLLTMITADLNCIRYAGAQPEIQRRLAEQGEGSLCDIPPDGSIIPLNFDHVGVTIAKVPFTLDALIADFARFLSRQNTKYRFRVASRTHVQCELGISWWKEDFLPMWIRQSEAREFDWLIIGPPLLVHDWLVAEPSRFSYSFYSAADWNGPRADRRRIPW